MRDLRNLDRWRFNHPLAGAGDHGNGCFLIPHQGVHLRVIASNGEGWDHVSVSLPDRCPTWEEMAAVARLFFYEGEAAFQLHVPRSDHVNVHPFCLHWWRPNDGREFPRPPARLVG